MYRPFSVGGIMQCRVTGRQEEEEIKEAKDVRTERERERDEQRGGLR